MNNTTTQSNEVVVVKTDKKVIDDTKEIKAISSNVLKRIVTVCKAHNVKLNNVEVKVIAESRTQASVIDLCFRTKATTIKTAETLVNMKLCTDMKHALARIKRHNKHDKESRIIARNLQV